MPNSALSIFLTEPVSELLAPVRRAFEAEGLPVLVPGDSVEIMDSSPYLHDEASLLDADELDEARRALIEDGIFPDGDWHGDELRLRPAVKYGWALAHLEQMAADSSAEALVWSVADGFETTTPAEWTFIASEAGRRANQVRWIAPCTPSRFEPGVAYDGNDDSFAAWFSALESSGFPGVMFRNAEEKASLFPCISRRPDFPVALEFACLGWTEALRTLARDHPTLFRELLPIAQERFVFDKGPHLMATSEDDIRSLPAVSDAQLESTFIDDFRGRQLLQVTAGFLLQDQERSGRILEAVFARRDAWEASITNAVRRQVDPLRKA